MTRSPRLKAKATEVVAKKAGVSTRTFERGKKIIEEATEDEKQKLREGKASITHVYNEIVSSTSEQKKAAEPPGVETGYTTLNYKIKQNC